jgi:hypothetical protein
VFTVRMPNAIRIHHGADGHHAALFAAFRLFDWIVTHTGISTCLTGYS